MEAFLSDFLPRALPEGLAWRAIDHGSKWQLLRRLPERLIGYSRFAEGYRPKALVLVDRDDDDCLKLKELLEKACRNAGLTSKSSAMGGAFDVVNRIVVEELEAWYFGDVDAVVAGWPGVPATLVHKARYRDPDAIAGGTHEAFLDVLQRAGHLKGATKLPKIDAARRMAALMDPSRNLSTRFNHFLTGLYALVQTA